MYNNIKRNKSNIPVFNLNPIYSSGFYYNIPKFSNLLKNYIHIFNNINNHHLFHKKTYIRLINNKYYGIKLISK
jgi:hypothetical protein